MFKPGVRFSKAGLVAAGLFLSLALATFLYIFFVASMNPADSGESGLLLVIFAMPWLMWVPTAWVGPYSAMAMVLFNALLLYLVFGGLRLKRR